MKTILHILFFLFIQQIASAQFKQNKWVIGGDFGFTSNGGTTYFGFAPEIGYRFSNNFELGGGVGYTQISTEGAKRKLWNFGPYLNYNITESFFARSKYQYLTGTTTGTSTHSNNNLNEFSLWIGGGYQFLSDSFFYRAGFLYNVLYNADSSIYNSPMLPYVSIGYQL